LKHNVYNNYKQQWCLNITSGSVKAMVFMSKVMDQGL